MGGDGEIMGGHGWWQQNYGCSWMVTGGGGKIMAGHGWSFPLFSLPPPFKVFQTVPPTLMQPHPALIQHTNLPYT